jgi:hypothetical protein
MGPGPKILTLLSSSRSKFDPLRNTGLDFAGTVIFGVENLFKKKFV